MQTQYAKHKMNYCNLTNTNKKTYQHKWERTNKSNQYKILSSDIFNKYYGGRAPLNTIHLPQLPSGAIPINYRKMPLLRDKSIFPGSNGIALGSSVNSTPFLHYKNHFFPRAFSNTLRILNMNVLEGIYWHTNKLSISVQFDAYQTELLREYIKQISPDVITTQEDNSGSSGLIVNCLDNKFNLCACQADRSSIIGNEDQNELLNTTYWNASIKHICTDVVSGNGMDDDRCGTTTLFDWNGYKLCIINVHLEVSNPRDRNSNILTILNKYKNKYASYPTIIIGDFNDYNKDDYYANPTQSPNYDSVKSIKIAHNWSPSNIFDILYANNFFDMFKNFAMLMRPLSYMDYIPTNTSIYGGKTEHAFCNKSFLDTFNFAITPLSPYLDISRSDNISPSGLEDDALISDHLPILVEITQK